jgi:hypothetical protein
MLSTLWKMPIWIHIFKFTNIEYQHAIGKLYVDLATILENNISETFTNSRIIYKVPQIGDEIVC